ncbi:MAG: NAD(P)H-dependent oxidoreductase [Proteobacteria bacterium]|nr:NAD(P)H-dependent oxidoreductase [Pseudomonadota bacterium]
MSLSVLVILGHPDPASFNHAIAQACVAALTQNGHHAIFHDLCAEGFDPALPAPELCREPGPGPDAAAHCAELAAADGLVVVHPNWWGQPPAVLKGWVDRVFRPDVAYRFVEGDTGEGVPQGLLKARAAVVFNTANTPRDREREAFGDPLERIWRDCIFGLCGVNEFHRRTFSVMCTSTREEREAWLGEAAGLAARVFPPGA